MHAAFANHFSVPFGSEQHNRHAVIIRTNEMSMLDVIILDRGQSSKIVHRALLW